MHNTQFILYYLFLKETSYIFIAFIKDMKIFVLLARFILNKIKKLTISVIACADQQQMKSLQIAVEVIIKNRLISTIDAFYNL